MNEDQSIEETRTPEDDFKKPYRTPKEVSDGSTGKRLRSSKRMWFALIALLLFGGGALGMFALYEVSYISRFGDLRRGPPRKDFIDHVKTFGDDDRPGEPMEEPDISSEQ